MAGAVISNRIHLKEYGSPQIIAAEKIDLQGVARANLRWKRTLGLSKDPLKVEKVGQNHVKLRAEGVTGVVRIGFTDIEIAPKFLQSDEQGWQTVLLRILATVEGGYIDQNTTSADHLDSESLPDLLAEIFLASYYKGAARGLPRGYMTQSSAGPVLRGNLDHSRFKDLIARPWEIPYVADILTDDTALTRLLRWSAERLAATVKAPGRARAVREIASNLSHVGHHPPHPIDAMKVRIGTQHQQLEGALAVGLILLEGTGVHHASGKYDLSGFLWNSDVVYENYVYWLCTRAASEQGLLASKKRTRFGEVLTEYGSAFETTPDVVFRGESSEVIAITDAKYKHFGNRPKASDTYQVLTAAQVLGCERVSLTYPVSVTHTSTVWRVPSGLGGKSIEVTALPLNLMCLLEPNGQKKLITQFVSWMNRKLFAIPREDHKE